MSFLVTGAAGFIGFHLSVKLLKKGIAVIGFDNLNSYYDPALKHARLKKIKEVSENTGTRFDFIKGDIHWNESGHKKIASYISRKCLN